MKKTNRLKELAGRPEFIPGIYNYCDRWCERCPMTARCMNYSMAEERFPDAESQDLENEEFWQTLSGTFKEAMALLREMAAAHGIDLDNIDVEEEQARQEKTQREAKDHP